MTHEIGMSDDEIEVEIMAIGATRSILVEREWRLASEKLARAARGLFPQAKGVRLRQWTHHGPDNWSLTYLLGEDGKRLNLTDTQEFRLLHQMVDAGWLNVGRDRQAGEYHFDLDGRSWVGVSDEED